MSRLRHWFYLNKQSIIMRTTKSEPGTVCRGKKRKAKKRRTNVAGIKFADYKRKQSEFFFGFKDLLENAIDFGLLLGEKKFDSETLASLFLIMPIDNPKSEKMAKQLIHDGKLKIPTVNLAAILDEMAKLYVKLDWKDSRVISADNNPTLIVDI